MNQINTLPYLFLIYNLIHYFSSILFPIQLLYFQYYSKCYPQFLLYLIILIYLWHFTSIALFSLLSFFFSSLLYSPAFCYFLSTTYLNVHFIFSSIYIRYKNHTHLVHFIRFLFLYSCCLLNYNLILNYLDYLALLLLFYVFQLLIHSSIGLQIHSIIPYVLSYSLSKFHYNFFTLFSTFPCFLNILLFFSDSSIMLFSCLLSCILIYCIFFCSCSKAIIFQSRH